MITDSHVSSGSTARLTAPVRLFVARVASPGGRRALLLTVILSVPVVSITTGAETAQQTVATLYAENGDYVPGRFVPLASGDQIRWKSHLFTAPITFDIAGLEKITFGSPPKPRIVREPPRSSNPFVTALNKVLEVAANPPPASTNGIEGSRIQLSGRNVMFGEVLSLDDNFLTLRSKRHDVVRIHRSAVRHIEGLSRNNDFLFDGIGDFRSCLCLGNGRSASDWERSGGGLATKTKGANLYHELSHFGSYLVELELTASRQPVFQIGLGASRDLSRLKQAFSVEVWNNRLLTAHRQVGETFQRATLGELGLRSQRTTNLEIYFDHKAGRITVYSLGRLLGEFHSEAELDVLGNGIFLRNNGRNLNVTRFRVRKWNGTPPQSHAKADQLIRSADGDWIEGAVTAINGETQQVTIATDEGARTLDLAQVDQVAFPDPRQAPADSSEPNIQVDYLDGSHVEGQLVNVAADGIEIQLAASPDPILLGWDNMFQVTFSAETTESRDAARSPGLLEVTGCRLHGRVVNATEEGIILWVPANSDTSVPINLSSKARVTFEPSDATQSERELNDQLHLVNGDTIPCDLISIDEQAIRVRFADGEVVAVPRDVFKAVHRNPLSSHIYAGFDKGDRWYVNRGRYAFENGALNLTQPVLLARDVDLPDRARISFDARWSGDNVVLIGFGADSPKNALRRRANYSFSQEMLERESKKKPDYFGEFMITRQGKSLTARGYTRSAGPLGQMFFANQFMMNSRLQQTASLALSANATAHIEVLVDRTRREYAIVANGRQLYQWRDSTKVDGGTIHIGVQQLSQNNRSTKQRQIGSVQLLNLKVSRWPGAIPADKLERLLTRRLGARPRVTTHVLRAFNGDSLRGRLIAVQDNVVTFEARLDTFRIPLDKIAEIVSLNEIAVDEGQTQGALFRAALRGGGSVTIKPMAVTDALMIGESPLIGKTSVPWYLVSALDFGSQQSAREIALANWKLHSPPPLPDAPTPESQLPSPLIGEPAPDVELEILEDQDKYVQLADLKGRIVILDFWATWCGPCLASMPTLMDIAAEFGDEGVEFIAVNQQEDPDDVRDFLATRGWDLTVALDSDALISRRYGVAGIPFTVIIDKEGIVRHVHVGAAASLEQTLRAELQELLSSAKTGSDSDQ